MNTLIPNRRNRRGLFPTIGILGISLALLMLIPGARGEEANPACVPTPRDDWSTEVSAQWTAQAEEAYNHGKSVPVLFLGDSMFHTWWFPADHEKTPGGADSWNKYFKPMGAVNFGMAGDRTEHLLWRITEGGQLRVNPRVVVLQIGTNNIHTKEYSSEQIAEGVKRILDEIREQLPDTKILLLGLLPRSWGEWDGANVLDINSIISGYADKEHIFYFDPGAELPNARDTALFRDGIHLTPEGYEVFSKELLPEIEALLN